MGISPSTAETNLAVPYSEVIYRINEKSPNQIFIIGLSHRDSLTCLNGELTSKVQAEVFKIGDWLIHNQELGLLLPEGFFKSRSPNVQRSTPIGAARREGDCASYDMSVLEKRLSDNKVYINAEMLLKEAHPIRLRQVEDKPLYDAVRASMLKLGGPGCDYPAVNSELQYLQERRSAAMLQKIPEIVNDEFHQGNIKSRKAIFTVGLYHIHEIIRFLNQNRIMIHSPKPASISIKDCSAELNLQKENFGITIILPSLLTKDEKILEINKLAQIVKQYRGIQTTKVSSPPSLQP